VGDGDSGDNGPDDPDGSADPGSSESDLRAVFSSYVPFDSEEQYFVRDGARAADSDLWISGEFPYFLINWSPGWEVTSVNVDCYFDSTSPNYEYSIVVVDEDHDEQEYILSPVVYGAYNIPDTRAQVLTEVPSPPITLGTGGQFDSPRFTIGDDPDEDTDSTVYIRVSARGPQGGTAWASVFYQAEDLNDEYHGDELRDQCRRGERECIP